MQFRINEYGTLKVVSTDKLSPVEPLKECHLERDGDVEMAPTSKDNPTVAQGQEASLAGVQRTGFYELSMESACSHGSFQLPPSSPVACNFLLGDNFFVCLGGGGATIVCLHRAASS